MIEQEVKFLEVNPAEIRNKLLSIGAKHLPEEIQSYRIFDAADGSIIREHSLLRLRKEHGKVVLAFKKKNENEGNLRRMEEIEIEVSDYDLSTQLLLELGFVLVREMEKKRESFEWKGIKVDVDTYPPQLGIPTFLEVEGNDITEMKNLIEKVGLNWDDGKSWSGLELMKHHGIQIEKIKSTTF